MVKNEVKNEVYPCFFTIYPRYVPNVVKNVQGDCIFLYEKNAFIG